MNANPHTCAHRNLVYEKVAGGDPFIRCDDCHTTWDADEPISDEHKAFIPMDAGWPADWPDEPRLNPDNEPTSEHQQWRKDNDDA